MDNKNFSKLDPVIHSRIRLAILSILISVEEAEFNYLKENTGATDGNLSTHLSKLESAGMVKIKKSFKGKRPLTTCSVTKKGRESFAKYVTALEQFIQIPGTKKGR